MRRSVLVVPILALLGPPGAISLGGAQPMAAGVQPGNRSATRIEIALSEALALAAEQSPRVLAAAQRNEAVKAGAVQSGARPNPEIEVEAEDVDLSGGRGFDDAAVTFRASQTLEMGGKRAKRRAVASVEAYEARWSVEAVRQEVLAAVKGRFVELLAAQERLRLLRASCEASARLREAAAERVRIGHVPPLELSKAEAAHAGRSAEAARAEGALRAACIRLGAQWGLDPAEALRLQAKGDLAALGDLPPFGTLERRLDSSPEAASVDAAVWMAEAVLARERAARLPDATVTVGVTHSGESGNESLEVAVSLPIPFFDRNRGNVGMARGLLSAAMEDRRATAVAQRADLAEHMEAARAAREEAATLSETVLPASRHAAAATEEAYRLGKVSYLDVIDAQQRLFDTEMQEIEALAEFQLAVVSIERVIGGRVAD
ncbi:MAG: TolC family protein [Lentisphaeria bacterium]|nr:TolC family protein [Lentisphaeria bacterium]